MGADENGGTFGMDVPITIHFFATHEDMNADGVGQLQIVQPFTSVGLGLLHQRPHWQAINEAARPVRILKLDTIPQPGKHDGGSFAKPVGMLIS